MESTKTQQYNYTSAAKIDSISIENMSFVPNKQEREALYKNSELATLDIIAKKRTPKLSKLYNLPGKIGLCPDSLEPNDTVLAGMGANRVVEGAVWIPEGGGQIGNKDIMTVLNDKCMLFGGGSNGPNGVLTDCNMLYGGSRVNLFYCNEDKTKSLLKDYLEFRDKELKNIFHLLVEHIHKTEFIDDFKLDPKKDKTPDNLLSKELQNDYKNLCEMFHWLDTNEKELSDCGIGCVSYCQTWLRKNGVVGDAQFSVMSPHFQTRFYVTDDDKVLSSGITQEELNSYIKLVEHFNKCMDKPYGIGGGGQAFVNLDLLAKELNC